LVFYITLPTDELLLTPLIKHFSDGGKCGERSGRESWIYPRTSTPAQEHMYWVGASHSRNNSCTVTFYYLFR